MKVERRMEKIGVSLSIEERRLSKSALYLNHCGLQSNLGAEARPGAFPYPWTIESDSFRISESRLSFGSVDGTRPSLIVGPGLKL